MIKYCSLTFLFLCVISGTVGQNLQPTDDQINLQKYWYYRWRLQNDFVKVGEGVGHSLPIQSRKGIWWVNDIEVVDATIYLGFYIGVLATEYRLLLNNQRYEDVEKTKTELYYAIKAYERLDRFGEEMFGKEGVINGYIARDDIPCDFIDSLVNPDNYRHFNQNKTIAPGTGNVYKIQTSDYCFDGEPLKDLADVKATPEMSQDQVLWLLMGYMLVEKSFDQGMDSVALQDGTRVKYDFNFQARRHATNMINYCRYKYPEKPDKTKWRIFRPDGEKVFPGQNVFAFKYPLSHIGEMMYTEKAENAQSFKKKPGKFQWGLTKIWIPYKNVNGQMITILAAMSGKWGKDVEKTVKRIECTWEESNWGNFYLPLMNYLHGVDIDAYEIEDKVHADLNQAPVYGTHNMTNGIVEDFAKENGIPVSPEGWTCHLKYSSAEKYQNSGYADENVYRGFYAGLDYMLMHNLYYLTAKRELPEYQNLTDRTIDATVIEKKDEGKVFNSFHTIELKNSDSLSYFLHLRTGYEIRGEGARMKMREGMIETRFRRFDPWKPGNIQSNSYDWHEEFKLKKHHWDADYH